MKVLRYLLWTLLGILVLLLIVAAFLPRNFHVEGTTVINRPVQDVYNYVRFIKTQEAYAVWFEMDPEMEKAYSGIDGAIGGTLVWNGEKVGKGKQVITGLLENERVDIELYLMSDTEPARYYYTLESTTTDQTKVVIALDGYSPYPFNITSLFFDMGDYFQQNADNLKKVLEQQ